MEERGVRARIGDIFDDIAEYGPLIIFGVVLTGAVMAVVAYIGFMLCLAEYFIVWKACQDFGYYGRWVALGIFHSPAIVAAVMAIGSDVPEGEVVNRW